MVQKDRDYYLFGASTVSGLSYGFCELVLKKTDGLYLFRANLRCIELDYFC